MRRSEIAAILVTGAIAAVSVGLIVLSSSYFMYAAGRPAVVYGPSSSPIVLKLIVGATVVLFGLSLFRHTTRHIRSGAFLIWLIVLSLSTHRVVDVGPNGISDIWLGVLQTTDIRYNEIDRDPYDCQAFAVRGLCFTRGGRARFIPTIIPFTRMGTDGHNHLVPGQAALMLPPSV
jgi:hypothetical protein